MRKIIQHTIKTLTTSKMKKLLSITALTFLIPFNTSAQEQNDSTQSKKVLRHEFVQRGNHKSELNFGDYVVGGAFTAEESAKNLIEELKKQGFTSAGYGYLTTKKAWYLYLSVSNDIEIAKAERDKYRKLKMFKDAWLLTVHQ